MQIGHAARKKSNQDTTSLWPPADVLVYRKMNELFFVADGYGNKRIIVFDADTGEYKRMWGDFGNINVRACAPSPRRPALRVLLPCHPPEVAALPRPLSVCIHVAERQPADK
jgi:hypothetical protein